MFIYFQTRDNLRLELESGIFLVLKCNIHLFLNIAERVVLTSNVNLLGPQSVAHTSVCVCLCVCVLQSWTPPVRRSLER